MEHKRFLFWAVVLFLGLSSLASGYTILSARQCSVRTSARVNCGYPAISPEECNNRGCCYDASISGVVWCFFPTSDPECI